MDSPGIAPDLAVKTFSAEKDNLFKETSAQVKRVSGFETAWVGIAMLDSDEEKDFCKLAMKSLASIGVVVEQALKDRLAKAAGTPWLAAAASDSLLYN